MKREILFRGLSNQGKGWLYGDLIRNKREAIAIVPPHPLKVTHRYSCYEVFRKMAKQKYRSVRKCVGTTSGIRDI